MQDAGSALMGIGSSRGADRAIKAAELAVASLAETLHLRPRALGQDGGVRLGAQFNVLILVDVDTAILGRLRWRKLRG